MLNNNTTARADMKAGAEFPDTVGVHEHWNNIDDMEYSRNLETGEGIELVRSFNEPTSIRTNVCFELDEDAKISVEIYTLSGSRLLVK